MHRGSGASLENHGGEADGFREPVADTIHGAIHRPPRSTTLRARAMDFVGEPKRQVELQMRLFLENAKRRSRAAI